MYLRLKFKGASATNLLIYVHKIKIRDFVLFQTFIKAEYRNNMII